MGYCSNCGNWVDEGSICSHCGSGGGGESYYDYEDYLSDLEEFKEDLDTYGYYDIEDPVAYTPEGERLIKAIINRNKAHACSEKKDHLNAIKYYRKSLEATRGGENQCKRFSCLAREYEAIGDYASAEECWGKCCGTSRRIRQDSIYVYIARKADFLYRRERFEEALEAYEESLTEINSKIERTISLYPLRCYAKVTHSIIDTFERLGEDNHEEKYHNGLKHAISRYIRSQKYDDETMAHYISRTGWEVYRDYGLADEAIIFIDSAIEFYPDCPANDYNRKAIILGEKSQYEDALKYFDKALSIDKSNETILKNRAVCEAECIRSRLKIEVLFRRVESSHLDLINKALKILPEDYDNGKYLKVKAEILDQLGEPVKAEICRALAVKHYDEVEEAERQLKRLKAGETYINITGIQFYKNFEPFGEGTIVNLVREPDNPHDRDAIRVEVGGETVGYVANSKYTVIKEVKSATEIKDTGSTQAEVQFILFRKWVITKLI